MKTVNFLYGKTTLNLEVPDNTPVLTSNIDELRSDKSGYDIVAEAMENPIDSPRLYELAKGKPDCTIIISDHTRPVPSQDILPHMIHELRLAIRISKLHFLLPPVSIVRQPLMN